MPITSADCDRRPDSRSCSAWYIAQRLGHRGRGEKWILEQIRILIDQEVFPPPLPIYAVSTRRRVEGLTPSHRWNTDAVDAWFDGTIPQHLIDAIRATETDVEAAELDQRAAALAGGIA